MKYVVRKGMFETNSSSTHEMILAIDGKDAEGKEAGFDDNVFYQLEGGEVRYIRSKNRKARLLYQFKYDRDIASVYGDLKEYFQDLGTTNQDFFNLGLELEELGQKLRNLSFYKGALKDNVPDLTDAELEAIESTRPRYMNVCNECFWNDVLDDCHCGLDYNTICSRFGVDSNNLKEEMDLIPKFLEDKVVVIIREVWMGGYMCDIPTDL